MKILFLQQLRNDSSWLADNQIMDYSLLCGMPIMNSTPPSPKSPAPSPPGLSPCLDPPEAKKPKQRILISLKSNASEKSKEKLRKLAITNIESPSKENKRASGEVNVKSIFEQSFGGVASHGAPKQILYYFGIIDICQVACLSHIHH